ncbi:MAG: DUF4185 domain-containing protein [Verrucomicrobiia bacterium]
MRVRLANLLLLLALCLAAVESCVPARAQNIPVLTWNTNSSVKLQQLIGEEASTNYAADTDRQTGAPLLNQTYTDYQVGGTDLGSSFVSGNQIIFLFGDTLYFNSGDTMAWTTNTSPGAGVPLTFFTTNTGTALLIQPPGVDMGSFDVPAAGISNNGTLYIVCKTGYSPTTLNSNDFSVLATFNETTHAFATGRTISSLTNGGHFIDMSLHTFGTNILMYGLGYYRQSAVYLATIPTNSFETGAGTLYFTGLTNGLPTWSTAETNAVPLVSDNPTNPTIGNVSVTYSPDLNLWLMTYDGGRQTESTMGVYFSYAQAPWGPWSTPQLIFNARRDDGFGVFMHNTTNSTPAGPAGPTIDPADNPPDTTPGGVYAPYVIENFTKVVTNTLSIYYTMSTWNPYTIVLMESDFTINPVINLTSVAYTNRTFTISWTAPTNESFRVDFSNVMPPGWTTFTNIITSATGAFKFTDDGLQSGGWNSNRFYRVHTGPWP